MTDGLSLAQVFADLSTLMNAENDAAHALLSANKSLSTSHDIRRKSRQNSLPERPVFDSLGKRLMPQPLSRTGSNMSSRSSGDPTPPSVSPEEEKDEDLKRADELVKLYHMRGKFKQMGDTGLGRAKERVDAVMEIYEQKDMEERERVANKRHLGIK